MKNLLNQIKSWTGWKLAYDFLLVNWKWIVIAVISILLIITLIGNRVQSKRYQKLDSYIQQLELKVEDSERQFEILENKVEIYSELNSELEQAIKSNMILLQNEIQRNPQIPDRDLNEAREFIDEFIKNH